MGGARLLPRRDGSVVATGRGAWSSRGQPPNVWYYTLGSGYNVGQQERLLDGTAVHAGVIAIQRLVNEALKISTGFVPLIADGQYGPKTTGAVQRYQAEIEPAVVAGVPFANSERTLTAGTVNLQTAYALCQPLITRFAMQYAVPVPLARGIIGWESRYDFGCVGVTHDADRGLAQWNTDLGTVTVSQANDPWWAIEEMIKQLALRFVSDAYGRNWAMAVAGHNAPTFARGLWDGTDTDSQRKLMLTYISNVLAKSW